MRWRAGARGRARLERLALRPKPAGHGGVARQVEPFFDAHDRRERQEVDVAPTRHLLLAADGAAVDGHGLEPRRDRPPERVGEYLRKLRQLFDQYGYGCDLYGHFGQGCIHTRIDFDLETQGGIEKFHRFEDDMLISLSLLLIAASVAGALMLGRILRDER